MHYRMAVTSPKGGFRLQNSCGLFKVIFYTYNVWSNVNSMEERSIVYAECMNLSDWLIFLCHKELFENNVVMSRE